MLSVSWCRYVTTLDTRGGGDFCAKSDKSVQPNPIFLGVPQHRKQLKSWNSGAPAPLQRRFSANLYNQIQFLWGFRVLPPLAFPRPHCHCAHACHVSLPVFFLFGLECVMCMCGSPLHFCGGDFRYHSHVSHISLSVSLLFGLPIRCSAHKSLSLSRSLSLSSSLSLSPSPPPPPPPLPPILFSLSLPTSPPPLLSLPLSPKP